jgi:integrase
MPGRQAKTLSSADVDDLLVFASCTRNPVRNRVIVLLSAKAGLRAGEIASLTWDMVLGPTSQISGIIELRVTTQPRRAVAAASPSIRISAPLLLNGVRSRRSRNTLLSPSAVAGCGR